MSVQRFAFESITDYIQTILRVLCPAANHESKVADALYDLFWHLRYRSLPADPIPLTVAFGWKNYQIHEQQDLFEFYRVFSQRLEQVYGTNITEAFKGRYRITLKPGELEFSESSRVEEFYGTWRRLPPMHST